MGVEQVYFSEENSEDPVFGGLITDYLALPSRPEELTISGEQLFGEEMFPKAERVKYTQVERSECFIRSKEPFVAYGGELPFDVLFLLGFDGVESPVLDVRFTVRPDRPLPVTAARLREIPLQKLVSMAIADHRAIFRRIGPGKFVRASGEEHRRLYTADLEQPMPYTTRRRISDEDMQRVTEVYRLAVANRERPTEAVERDLGLLNRNMAKKWVERARRLGYLEPAPGERKAGLQRD